MNRLPGVLFGLAFLVGFALFDHWLFQKYLNIVHWRWYLSAGARISLVTAIAGIAWGDLNKNKDSISAVCGELVLKPRRAGDTGLGSNYANGRR